jgi:hypothetical protein
MATPNVTRPSAPAGTVPLADYLRERGRRLTLTRHVVRRRAERVHCGMTNERAAREAPLKVIEAAMTECAVGYRIRRHTGEAELTVALGSQYLFPAIEKRGTLVQKNVLMHEKRSRTRRCARHHHAHRIRPAPSSRVADQPSTARAGS